MFRTAPCVGVSDGTRTRDHRDHNQVLYQLSYTHQVRTGSLRGRWKVYPTQAGGSAAEVLSAWSTTWFVAAARAWSVDGPGTATNSVSR